MYVVPRQGCAIWPVTLLGCRWMHGVRGTKYMKVEGNKVRIYINSTLESSVNSPAGCSSSTPQNQARLDWWICMHGCWWRYLLFGDSRLIDDYVLPFCICALYFVLRTCEFMCLYCCPVSKRKQGRVYIFIPCSWIIHHHQQYNDWWYETRWRW